MNRKISQVQSSLFSHRPTQKYTDVFFSSYNLSACVCVRLWLIILNQMIQKPLSEPAYV